MGVDLALLIDQMHGSLYVEVNAPTEAEVARIVPLAGFLESVGQHAGVRSLGLADPLWLRQTAPNELRSFLSAAKERGLVGVVALGSLNMSPEAVNVFRQLKLLLGSAPQIHPETLTKASDFRHQLQAVLDRGVEHDQRRLAVVQQLLAAMNEASPLSALITQLGHQCEGSALLYDTAGTVVESTGSAPAHLVHKAIAHHDLATGAVTVGRWHAIGRSISIRTQSYLLVVASRSPEVLEELGEFMLDSVAQLLGTFQALDSFAAVQQVHNSSHLLRELELGISLGKEVQYWDRLREFGFPAFTQLRFVAVSTAGGRLLTKSELASIAEFAARSGTPVLVSEHVRTSESPPGFHMLAQASTALEEWLSRLSGSMSVGVSQRYSQLSRTPAELRSGQLAKNLAQKRLESLEDQRSTVVYVDALSPAEWLLARAHSNRDQAHLEEYVSGLREDPQLLRTLLVHLSHRMRVADASRALGVHQNTLRYRLTKIEGVLQVQLSDPAVVANLYLALYDELANVADL